MPATLRAFHRHISAVSETLGLSPFGDHLALHDPSPIPLGHALEQRLSGSPPSAKAP
jgi:hypothetical protein